MPWFPDFIGAVDLARRQTRAESQADPVGQYIAALNSGDTHPIETPLPGEVVVYDPRAGTVRGRTTGRWCSARTAASGRSTVAVTSTRS
jgi:hypothetical protein